MTEIVTLTLNPAVDLSFSVERMVDTRKLRRSDPRKDAGGGGINVARVAHRLGADCLALYAAGGETGRLLRALLEAEEVPACELAIAGDTRENIAVLERSTGREFRFVLPGPRVSQPEWLGVLEHIDALAPAPHYLVASGSLPPGVPPDFYARLARSARAKGYRLAVDASGEALAAALAEGVYLVKPSLDELRELTGKPLISQTDWRDAACGIVRSGQGPASWR